MLHLCVSWIWRFIQIFNWKDSKILMWYVCLHGYMWYILIASLETHRAYELLKFFNPQRWCKIFWFSWEISKLTCIAQRCSAHTHITIINICCHSHCTLDKCCVLMFIFVKCVTCQTSAIFCDIVVGFSENGYKFFFSRTRNNTKSFS